MTVFNTKLESTKKIEKADVLVGVDKIGAETGPLTVVKTVDPNISHPLRQMDIAPKLGEEPTGCQIDNLHGIPLTTHVFTAIVWKYGLKDKRQYCWQLSDGNTTRYSRDILSFLKNLSADKVNTAITDYRQHLRVIRNK